MTPRQTDELARLDDLRRSGALTDEEFAAEKAALLAPRRFPRWPLVVGGGAVAIGAAVAIGVFGGQEMSPPAATPSAVPSPVASQTATPVATTDWPLADAFAAATGHASAYTEPGSDGDVTITPQRVVPLSNGIAALIAAREIADGCHACAGGLAVYYLRDDGGSPALVRAFPQAVSGNGFGGAPSSWSVTDRFTSTPAIYAEAGFTGQGITQTSATITELTPAGPVTSGPIGIGYSDAGAQEDENAACVVTGRIGNVVKDGEFDVTRTGSRPGMDHYVKQNGRFVAVKKIDWEMPCGAGLPGDPAPVN